jgi:hypothetical protein
MGWRETWVHRVRVSRGGGGGHVVGGRAGDGFFIAPPMVVPYEATNVGVELKGVRNGFERRRWRGLNARDPGRRETPGEVLKDRRLPRRRGRMGTSVKKRTHQMGTSASAVEEARDEQKSTDGSGDVLRARVAPRFLALKKEKRTLAPRPTMRASRRVVRYANRPASASLEEFLIPSVRRALRPSLAALVAHCIVIWDAPSHG